MNETRGRRIVNFKVDGLPPKKSEANSMWGKKGQPEEIKRLRGASRLALDGKTVLSDNIALRIVVHLRPERRDDLPNFIGGICDALQPAHPNVRNSLHPELATSAVDAFQPAAITDDWHVVSINAEKISDTSEWYEVELEGR